MGKVHFRPGVEHAQGQVGALAPVELADEHGHEEGRHLVVGHAPGGEFADNEEDLLAGQRAPVPLFRDDIVGAHGHPSG